MKIGYARISTEDQQLGFQIDLLKAAGCERIYTDVISGSKTERSGLTKALEQLREGDTFVVWRLDRLGRSLKHLIEAVEDFKSKGVGFVSLHENIDTTTPTGKLVFHFFGAIAEFERDLIRERTKAGLAAARARGKKGGRRQQFKQSKIDAAVKYANEHPDKLIKDVCDLFGISISTYYKRSKG